MKNVMTVQEVCELNQKNPLFVRQQVINGRYNGEVLGSNKRKTYTVYRYWFYRNILGWSDTEISQYHNSPKGRYWLNYEPSANRMRNKKSDPLVETNEALN